jgi:hypothetical protein
VKAFHILPPTTERCENGEFAARSLIKVRQRFRWSYRPYRVRMLRLKEKYDQLERVDNVRAALTFGREG